MSEHRRDATDARPDAEFAMATPIDDSQYPPQSARYQASQGQSDFVDGSGPIFSMYLEMAEEEDKKMAERWKADADSILVFDIRQNSQDTSNFYLANIYRATVDPNRSSSLPISPAPFSPPTYAVWVNGLWFMSLVISITCAVLATLLQQWARRYLKVTQTRFSLHKRARIRTFFAEGVEKSLLPRVVEALPTLIHVSLVLFFAGLAVFLWNVNLTIFKLVLSWIGLCAALYGCTMLISIVRRDSPYYTPLTPLVLPVLFVIGLVPSVAGLCYGLFVDYWTRYFGGHQQDKFDDAADALFDFLKMTFMPPEKVALKSPPKLDTRALVWTFDRLDEDHELARFFSGLPAFQNSKVVKDPLRDLGYSQKWDILTAMIGFLDRTFSSDLLPDLVKRRRVDICGKVIDLLDTYDTCSRILLGLACASSPFEPVIGPAQSTEIVQFIRNWGDRQRGSIIPIPVTQAIYSIAVLRVKQHDDSWFTLASEALGVSQTVLRLIVLHGDSLPLVILIHITRQQFIYFWARTWSKAEISCALESASQFDVLNTSSNLQHEFCALWNQIVRKAQDDNDREIARWILSPLRSTYVALHRGTNSVPAQFSTLTHSSLGDPSMYPLCIDPSHILDDYFPTTFPRTVQHYEGDPISDELFSLSPPFESNLPVIPSLYNSQLAYHTACSLPISLTAAPERANANAIEDVIPGIASPYPTPGAFISARPRPSTPLASFSLQDEEDLRVPSDSLIFSLPSSDPVLDDTHQEKPSAII
ncbi:hypothetical protein V8E53_001829 [Lactarius tabidus]